MYCNVTFIHGQSSHTPEQSVAGVGLVLGSSSSSLACHHPVVAQVHSPWHFGGWSSVGWIEAIHSLLLGAKERGALRTRGVVFVEELVELVEVGGGAAVDVVPPVADEVLLVEHGPVRAEEAVEVAVRLAHVEHLQERRQEVYHMCLRRLELMP